MEKKCVFCKEHIDADSPTYLEESKMFMLEILMEQTSFEKELFIGCPSCEECNKTIQSFFNFKSKFMEIEDEFMSYANSDKKLNLYNVLVTTGQLKRFPNENVPIKVCRTCFKATQVQDYKQIKSLESNLAKMVTTCLPEFNVNLTDTIYFCPWCHSSLLQYYNFFVSCSEVTKAKKRASLDSSRDPLAVDEDEPEKKKQKLEASLLVNKKSDHSSSPLPLLMPVEPKKRGRGRPRKGEEVSKPGLPQTKIKQTKNEKKNPDKTTKVSKNTPTNVASMDDEIDSYECQICPAIYETKSAIEEHLKFHERDREFSCWKCGFTTVTISALKSHLTTHGFGLCTIVTAKMSRERKKKVSSGNDTSCNQKSTSTSNATSKASLQSTNKSDGKQSQPIQRQTRQNEKGTSLTSSKSNSSGVKKPTSDMEYFQCQICPKIVDTVSTLKEHLLFHEKRAQMVCWKCCKTIFYDSMTSLKAHLKTHGIKNIYKIINSKTNHPIDYSEDLTDAKDTGGTPALTSQPTSTISCPTCRQKFTDVDEYMTHSCTIKHSETTKPDEISCSTCRQKFPGVDEYMTHSCTFKHRGTTKTDEEQEKDIEKERQEFGCGHCSAVFYSLDDLDEHNCISTKSGSFGRKEDTFEEKNKSDTNKVGFIVGRSEHITTGIQTSLDSPRINSLSKTNDFEYECSYCLLTFHTIKELDNHACNGEPQITPTQKSSFNPPTTVKKEDIVECAYCSSLFESSLELEQHQCSSKPSEVSVPPIETAVIPDDSLNKLIKSEPQFDDFLVPDSPINLGRNSSQKQESKKIPQDTLERKNDENLKKKSVDDKDTTKKPQIDKKVLINKIANMFGVNIIEGKDRNKNENAVKKLNCVGCDFTTSDEKDLLFHINCCVKVIKCNYCNYRTNVSQKLEIHTWAVHNILIYACSNCSFTTSMEENYNVHILTHDQFRSDITDSDRSNNPVFQRFDKENNFCISNGKVVELNAENNGNMDTVTSKGNIVEMAIQDTNDYQGEENTDPNSDDEETLSADSVFPNDSNDSMEDAVPFEIVKPTPDVDNGAVTEAETNNERDPLATEPVWLVESSSLKENLAPEVEQIGDILVPEENNSNPSQTELIVPDRIIESEPPLLDNVKMKASNVEEDPLKSQAIPTTDKPDATVVINCDSDDSDNEFVESSQNIIFKVASLAEDVCTISASEASELISQGVPVVNKSSLATLDIDMVPTVTDDITNKSGTDSLQPNSSLSSLNLAPISNNLENNQENAVNQTKEDNFAKQIHIDQVSTQKNNKTSINTATSETESTEPFSSNESCPGINDAENVAKNENRRTSISKNTCNATTEETNKDGADDSDGSSVFVTDNEDSDIDNDEKLNKKAPIPTNPVLETLKGAVEENNDSLKIPGEKPFLPTRKLSIEDDSMVISDEDEDTVGKIDAKQTGVLDDSKSSKDISTKAVSIGQTNGNNVQKANLNILSDIIVKKTVVSDENSFIISDDEDANDGIVSETLLKGSLGTAEGLPFKIIRYSTTKKNYVQMVPNKNVIEELVVAKSASNSQHQNNLTPTPQNAAPNTCGKAQSEAQKDLEPLVQKLVAAKIIKDSFVVIEDNDNDNVDNGSSVSNNVANNTVDSSKEDKTEKPKSRNDSISSSGIIEVDLSQEDADPGAEDASQDSGDDCVFVSEDVIQSKDQGSSSTKKTPVPARKNNPDVAKDRVKCPPSPFILFMSKIQNEIKNKYPTLKKGAQRAIILDAWRNMPSEDRWPFMEEARLLKLLFYREHPELVTRKKKKKVQKSAAVIPDQTLPPPVFINVDVEEISD